MAVSIRHSFDHYRNLKEPKTRAGVRRLPMSKHVADALMRYKKAQALALAGSTDKDGNPVEQTEESPVILDLKHQRMNPNTFSAMWKRDRKALGVDGWCLHELRHSYLSMLALEGVHPRVMQDLAGHSDSRTTMEIYTHVNMDQKRSAADALESIMAQPEPESAPPTFTVIPGSKKRAGKAGRAVQG